MYLWLMSSWAKIVITHVAMAYAVMAYLVMADMAMAYIVMACVVVAHGTGLCAKVVWSQARAKVAGLVTVP